MKVTIIVGAGCTLADVSKKPITKRPPLDREFFSTAVKLYPSDVNSINDYIFNSYGYKIIKTDYDSLEGVMTKIYADIFNPSLEKEAIDNFRKLIKVFNYRIAETTNEIHPTNQRFLYQIISSQIKRGIQPEDLSIITFNQDIQVEKILSKIEDTPSYKRFGKIFNFPKCYWIDFDSITAPSKDSCISLFPKSKTTDRSGISILKLHGSLNWYSIHRSTNIKPNVLFNATRKLLLTRRASLETEITYTKKGGKRQHTFPVVVPPVTNKSSILHNKIKPLWRIAENRLKTSDEVIVFGYSCPASDFESMNLLQRSLRNRTKQLSLTLINPDTNIVKRYCDIIDPAEITFYRWPKHYVTLNKMNAK